MCADLPSLCTKSVISLHMEISKYQGPRAASLLSARDIIKQEVAYENECHVHEYVGKCICHFMCFVRGLYLSLNVCNFREPQYRGIMPTVGYPLFSDAGIAYFTNI